jgi:hypothetical protein
MVKFKNILGSNVWNFIEIKFGFASCTSLLLKLKRKLGQGGLSFLYTNSSFVVKKDNYFKNDQKKDVPEKQTKPLKSLG